MAIVTKGTPLFPASQVRTVRAEARKANKRLGVHKLDFLDAMTAWFGGYRAKAKNRMILVGDLNVAPLPTDVWSHKQLLKVVSHTPPETERLEQRWFGNAGWLDRLP